MGLSGNTTYNGLYNTFLGESTDYCEYALQGIQELYLQESQGLLEEFFKEKRFEFGNIANVGMYLMGIPKNGLKRIDTLHSDLKTKIENETSHLQTLIPTGASIKDRLYVKKVLLNQLDESWLETRTRSIRTVSRFKENQLSLTRLVDRINLVASYQDGLLSGTAGSIIVSLNLTSPIANTGLDANDGVSALTNVVSAHTLNMEKCLSGIKNGFVYNYNRPLPLTKSYGYFDEYVFFFKKLLNMDSLKYLELKSYIPPAKSLTRYKNDKLLTMLTNPQPPYHDGVKPTSEWKNITHHYLLNIQTFVKDMLNYDVKKYSNYFNSEGNAQTYLRIIKGTQPTDQIFTILFTESTTQLPLVKEFFKKSVVGTGNDSYNQKVDKNIFIS